MSAHSGVYTNNFDKRTSGLFKLDGVKNDPELGIVFDGVAYNPTVVELVFDSGLDMHLKRLECNNIPLLRLNIGSTNTGGYIEDLVTNNRMGLSYNKTIIIENIKSYSDDSNVCMTLESGINNFMRGNSLEFRVI